MQKSLKFLIIILAVAFIVPQITFAAWWNPFSWGIWNRVFHFQQTAQKIENQTNSTAGWKTYTNSEYGFEFKYPGNLMVYDKSSLNSNNTWDIYVGNVTIEGTTAERERSSYLYLEALKNKMETINIGGISGKKVEMTDSLAQRMGKNIRYLYAFVFNGDKAYSFFSDDNITVSQKDVFNKILSTFKFTK